jgi:predicted esterase
VLRHDGVRLRAPGTMTAPHADDPHFGQPLRATGAPLASARAAMVMIHGRGASADSILTLAPALAHEGLACLAPQAAGGTWYPYGFMSPIAMNEPGISSAMRSIDRAIAHIADAGIPPERTLFLGFSQGACLASEFVARHARRWGGLAALSGGVIGPDDTPRDYAGSLDGMPAFFGCSDVDGHIPAARVRESAQVFERLGGEVKMVLYPGMGHLVNEDEIDHVRVMIAGVLAS